MQYGESRELPGNEQKRNLEGGRAWFGGEVSHRKRAPSLSLLLLAFVLVGCRASPAAVCKKWEDEKLVAKCEAKAPMSSDFFADSAKFALPNSPLAVGQLVTYANDDAFARGADLQAKLWTDPSFGRPLVDARNVKSRTQLFILGATVNAAEATALKERVEALK